MTDDYIDNLPSQDIGNNASALEAPVITITDIKAFISPKLYSELSWDEKRESDEVTQSCIDDALTLAESLLHLVGVKLNLYSQTQQLVVKNLTIYQLYIYNGDRSKGKTYLERAEKIISDRYSSLEKERESASPVVSVTKKKRRSSAV